MTFNQINFQDELAQRMLALPSFQRLFSGDARARAGMSQRGRRRTKAKAVARLTDRGYTDTQARLIVQDAQDYASLLYNAE